MGTATGLTADRMLEIEAESIVSGRLDGDNLILKNFGGKEFNLGSLRGRQGDQGPGGSITSINGKTGSAVTLTAADIGSIGSDYQSTQDRMGLIELATQQETQQMLDAYRALTPASLTALTPAENRLGLVTMANTSDRNTMNATDKAVSPAWLKGLPGLPFAMATGAFPVPPLSGGQTTDLAITFPAGRFSLPPSLVILPGSNRYSTEVLDGSFSKNGFTARTTDFLQDVTRNTVSSWIAIQMSSTSATG